MDLKMSSNIPTLYYLVGLVGSGKTTYAHQLAKDNENTIVLSSDSIREELYGDESIQGDSQKVFNLLHKRVKDNLKNDVNVVYDATNVKSKRRRAFVESLNKIDCYKQCIIIATPYEECLKRNRNRDRVVPEYVIERMYRQWDTPWYFEGWNDIKIEYISDRRFIENYNKKIAELYEFDQDNPHHKLSLGKHCHKASVYITEGCSLPWSKHTRMISCAAAVHDLSKPFVKARKNSKGEDTDVSHYYCHEHCSGYDALFYRYFDRGAKFFNEEDVVYISVLVCLHMRPYHWERDNNEKMRLKYKNLWGEDLYSDICLLHEADKAAH